MACTWQLLGPPRKGLPLFMWSSVCLTSLDKVVQWLLLVAGTNKARQVLTGRLYWQETGTYSVAFGGSLAQARREAQIAWGVSIPDCE